MNKTEFPFFTAHPACIYADNAATVHKPRLVIQAITHFYASEYGTIARGLYTHAERVTERYEQARTTVQRFINAALPAEIVFTKNGTESINLVAMAWAAYQCKPGDEIVLTELEHHANLLPWLRLAQERGIILRYIPVMPDGQLDYAELDQLISSRTRLVAVTAVSNALGTRVDLERIAQHAQRVGARLLIDACQMAAYEPIDVQKLHADFLIFSGHKLGGPTGIGVLYANSRVHDQLKPYQLGGGMVWSVAYDAWKGAAMPQLLEAGTPPIAQAIGLAAAVEYLEPYIRSGWMQQYTASLCARLIEGLSAIKGVRVWGPVDQLKKQGHIVSFSLDAMHAHDVAAYLDTKGICVRAGHHCAQPLIQKLGADATIRASFFGYNTADDVDALVEAIRILFN